MSGSNAMALPDTQHVEIMRVILEVVESGEGVVKILKRNADTDRGNGKDEGR